MRPHAPTIAERPDLMGLIRDLFGVPVEPHDRCPFSDRLGIRDGRVLYGSTDVIIFDLIHEIGHVIFGLDQPGELATLQLEAMFAHRTGLVGELIQHRVDCDNGPSDEAQRAIRDSCGVSRWGNDRAAHHYDCIVFLGQPGHERMTDEDFSAWNQTP